MRDVRPARVPTLMAPSRFSTRAGRTRASQDRHRVMRGKWFGPGRSSSLAVLRCWRVWQSPGRHEVNAESRRRRASELVHVAGLAGLVLAPVGGGERVEELVMPRWTSMTGPREMTRRAPVSLVGTERSEERSLGFSSRVYRTALIVSRSRASLMSEFADRLRLRR